MKNVFTFLLLLFSLLCNGQSPKLFTTDKELSSSLINQIYQDRNGFIWIATEDGLNRYDGAKFTIYKHEPNNEHSLAHNFVRTVFLNSQQVIFDIQPAQHISGYPYFSISPFDKGNNIAFKYFSIVFPYCKWGKIVCGRIIHLNSHICTDKQSRVKPIL